MLNYLRNVRHLPFRITLRRKAENQEPHILTADAKRESRIASARAFVHSLNILVKYVRLYGLEHKRTEGQFKIAWDELQQGLPKGPDGNFLLGVSDNRLLVDGIPLETGQAERSFAQLLNTAGLASIQFCNQITYEDFTRLIEAFASSGSKAQDVTKHIKAIFGDNKLAPIRINEVKFVAADPATGDISIAAQIAAQTLGPEFKDWLNDPQKLLQLIAAAEGAQSGGAGVPMGSAPAGTAGAEGGVWAGGVVPLQEEEVMQAIRLLTRFGEASTDPNTTPEFLQQELSQTDPNTRVNLQQLLSSLAANANADEADTPLLMKAAEHMAIRFAMERFQKGEVKVNAVHQMLEHMSRQMDTLRQILRIQEDKMNKAGILVESHADILDRMFWAEVPEAGKKSVLLSGEAPCVPARNVRQFVEELFERGDKETAGAILRNYYNCLSATEVDPRRKTATGLGQLADLFALAGNELLGATIKRLGESLATETDGEVENLLGAAFVRLSAEATIRKLYGAVVEVGLAIETIAQQRPTLANDLRPRIGIENRLPEFIEEALHQPQFAPQLVKVLRKNSLASTEQVADRFFRSMRRDECDRIVELLQELGSAGLEQLRQNLRTGQPRQATAAVGLLSRLDVPTLLEILPTRMREWNRFYHDMVVRQIAFAAAEDRGRTLLELLEVLDPMVISQAVDEIGMSGDRSAAPSLLVIAQSGETQGRSPLLQLKAVESLGRLRDPDSIPTLCGLLEGKKMWKWASHRELRIAAAQSLIKIDARYGNKVLSEAGMEPAELAIAPLDAAPACPWVRQRRYERVNLSKPISSTISSSWGKSSISVRELSLGGGMGVKEDNLRVGMEANLEMSVGVRRLRGQVLLRRARVNEVGFEIVNMDLENRYRLRRLIMEALEHNRDAKVSEWDGVRKV